MWRLELSNYFESLFDSWRSIVCTVLAGCYSHKLKLSLHLEPLSIVKKQPYDWAIALAGPVELSLAQMWQYYLDLSSKGLYVQYIVFIAECMLYMSI